MQIRPIKTKADHRAALKQIERLMDAKPGTPAAEELGYSQLSLCKAPELVRDGAPDPRCRPIIHRVSSEAPANRVDGLVGA